MSIYTEYNNKQNIKNNLIDLEYEKRVIDELRHHLCIENPLIYREMVEKFDILPDIDENRMYAKYEPFIKKHQLFSLINDIDQKNGSSVLHVIQRYIDMSLGLASNINAILTISSSQLPFVKSWTYDKDGVYTLNTTYGCFIYSRLSRIFDLELIKETFKLDSFEGKCHVLALLAMDFNCCAATGIATGVWTGQEYYHSWIEDDNKRQVTDLTKDLIMPVDDYYRLYINQDKFVNKISSEELSNADLNESGDIHYLLKSYIIREINEYTNKKTIK